MQISFHTQTGDILQPVQVSIDDIGNPTYTEVVLVSNIPCRLHPGRFRSREEQENRPIQATELDYHQLITTDYPDAWPLAFLLSEDGCVMEDPDNVGEYLRGTTKQRITNEMLFRLHDDPGPAGAPGDIYNIVSCNPVTQVLTSPTVGHHLEIEITKQYNA